MQIFHTHTFTQELKRLPVSVKRLYKKQENLFIINWRDSRLHAKKLKGDRATFSFRITRSYRVLFVFADPESAFFVSIGHRKDIYE